MFTDIIGYTRLMSEDEHKALQILQKNRGIQKPLVKKHSGEFLKEMGDGTLLCFQSALDAVRCALEIQHAIKDDSDLNLRIGIHLGDIVFKDGDIFGDGVNVASRIERLAEGGGICISEQVYETIRNKPGIEAEFLSEKTLKNVDRPVKVYALKEDGLAFPQKAFRRPARFSCLKKRKYPVIIIGILVVFAILFIIYLIKSNDSLNLDENLIAVAIFENQTGDESLDPVGRMASDWITQGIANTGLVSVVPSVALKTNDNIHQNMDGIRALAEKTNARTIITGVFYKQGNIIQFHTHIVDAGESKIMSIVGPVAGPAGDPLNSIELLRQKVMSALAANFDQSFRIFSDRKLNPPLFEAYQEFLKGQELYYDHENVDANQHFFKAATIDTSYLLPVIWARSASRNSDEYEKADSLRNILKVNQSRLTPGEKHLLDYTDAWGIGDWEAVYNATKQVAKYNLLFKYEEGRSALYSNRLKEAIEKSLAAGPDTILFKAMYWEVLTEAYHLMGNYSEELKEARAGRELYPELFISLWNELRALAALGRMEEIEQIFNESLNLSMKIRDNANWTPGDLMTSTALELRAHGFAEESKLTIKRAIKWYEAQMETEHRFGLARAYYVAGEWGKSSELFNLLLGEYPDWDENNKYMGGIEGTSRGWSSYNMVKYIGYLGGIAAHQDIYEEAEQFAKQLAVAGSPDLYGIHFCWQARIAAIFGNKEKALQLLRDALADGYFIKNLHADMDMESLRDYPPFQELIKPKE